VKAQERRGFFLETTGFKRASGRWEDLEEDFGGLSPYSLIPHFRALHKESGTATQLDLKSAIANRQVPNKDVQYPQQLLWLIAHGC